jgi:hypothetical protein
MKISIKISDYIENINVISVYKSDTNRIILFAEILYRFAAIELIMFNNLTVIDELSISKFNEIINNENDIIFHDMILIKLNDNDIKLVLNQLEYNLIFKNNGEFYELDELNEMPQDSITNISSNFKNTMFKVYLKRSNILNKYTINDYLDKIRLVGVNNLTNEERKRLDLLVDKIK